MNCSRLFDRVMDRLYRPVYILPTAPTAGKRDPFFAGPSSPEEELAIRRGEYLRYSETLEASRLESAWSLLRARFSIGTAITGPTPIALQRQRAMRPARSTSTSETNERYSSRCTKPGCQTNGRQLKLN